jgi:hypothetical protein
MTASLDYAQFLEEKSHSSGNFGFKPDRLPPFLKDFQKSLVDWALLRGRAGIFADCGLGKTPMQLVWAEEIARRTDKRVLILTPLAVSHQTEREADKFGIDASRSQDGSFGNARIIITNYERLGNFNPSDFVGAVCDESSILKSFSGSTRKRITRFVSKMPYRLLCTATAAPNDYVELGTSSEALGELSHSDMLKRFFRQLDDKGQKQESAKQEQAEAIVRADPSYYMKLAYRIAQTIGQWRLKHHAVQPFWKWVASWARACRKPSDLGFSDAEFALPELVEREHVIDAGPADDMLFSIPAFGLSEERAERRRTLAERCAFVADRVNHDRPAVVWCHMDEEGDALEKAIPGARQIAGKTPDDRKIDLYNAFSTSSLRVLIIKPKIGAWGLNWQHCNHVVTFASHSYEQYYQSVRRCWRFGQTKPVTVDVVATGGEVRVLGNLKRKAEKASQMFDALVREMNSVIHIARENPYTNSMEVPSWLSRTR